jgi:hypothetical protein
MIPKFRAWDKETKTMKGMAEIYRNRNQEIELRPRDGNIILMQSTGLFDKDGQEIFEGDVISTYTDNLVVKRDNLLGFYLEVDEKRNYFAETADIEYLDLFAKDFGVAVKVLGNIYENPELLEV